MYLFGPEGKELSIMHNEIRTMDQWPGTAQSASFEWQSVRTVTEQP